jgi:hypothetical protein
MLYVINRIDDPLCRVIADDPVRPELPIEFRVNSQAEIFLLCDDLKQTPAAAVCVAYRSWIPPDLHGLSQLPDGEASVAVFYTIWSYRAGDGRRLITLARDHISQSRPQITRYVTLSPPTEMARIFHLRNGAEVFRVNSDSVNYLYAGTPSS